MQTLNEKELLKKALSYVLLIRYLKDYIGFHVLADGEPFTEEVIKSLQKAADEFNNEQAKKSLFLLNKHSDSYLNLHLYLDSDECAEALIQPLKQFIGWNDEKDEKIISELANKFKERISKRHAPQQSVKTLKNEWKRAKKIIKVASFAAAGAGVVVGLVYLFRKKNNTPK